MTIITHGARLIGMARTSTGLLGLGFCLALLSCRGTDINMATNLRKPQGINVSITCNTSGNVTLIKWFKNEAQFFAYSPRNQRLGTNFTSGRMSVDSATPTVLHISHVQESDEGIYTCEVAALTQNQLQIQTWNLTIYKADDSPSTGPLNNIYIISAATVGIFIIISCGILCIYRIKKKQNPSAPWEPNGSTVPENPDHRQDQRTRRHQSSQYFERYNSVYGQF